MRWLATILALLCTSLAYADLPAFALREGDRVVFVGDTFIEQEQYHGYIEMALTTRFADKSVTFRNIGWSADTPAGDSRFGLSLLQAGLEPADEGWKQLQKQLAELKPTVLIVGYGMADSFAGEAGLAKFVANYNRLLDFAEKQSLDRKLRVLLIGPGPHFKLPAPLPDPQAHNLQLSRYNLAVQEIAQKRGAYFVDLLSEFAKRTPPEKFSSNGIHLTAEGYREAARIIFEQLRLGYVPSDNKPEAEPLRQAILKKNEWFFHRSRPANMAYIFGFRRGEQGRNAVEIPQFDKFIAAEEIRIAKLRTLKPVEVPAEPVRTKAVAAKFTPQPRPNFTVAEGFEVTLWAENPLLFKPIQMNFDARGRLWVASSEVYPQIEPGQTANDKILILEDTTGKGVADKSTVFAEGLLIPTGLEVGDGGCYVAQSTELLHFRDTNGDGKADVRRVVLSGFGTEDTHHNLHTLRFGPDGRLFMNQSIYTRTDTETPHGVARLKSGGTWRFDSQAQKLEVLFRGWVNSWGHTIDRYGQSFLTDGAGGDGISWGVPGAMYTAYARARRLMGSISPGGYPKFCSLEIIHSPHFPDDWQGDFVTCDFRANRIVRFKVTDNGSGFITQPMPDLLRSKEVSFRPIDVRIGPDGALYVADWSNPIINHGEVDFRDPRRDREHGRIWRITAKNRPTLPTPKLVDAPVSQLLDALLSASGYERHHARRVLLERGPVVLKDVPAWLMEQKTDEAKLEALWLYQGFRQPNESLLTAVMSSSAGPIRAAGCRVAGDWLDEIAAARKLLAEAIEDINARVRLEAVRALARDHRQPAQALQTILGALDQTVDRFIDYALWLSANELAEPWLEAVASEQISPKLKAIEFVMKSVEPSKANMVLSRLLAKQTISRDGQGPWIELIGAAGSVKELQMLFERAARGEFEPAVVVRVLNALAEAARLRGTKPNSDLRSLGKFLDVTDSAIRLAAVRLVGRWKVDELAQRVRDIASAKESPVDLRLAALDALADLRSPATIKLLANLSTDASESAEIRRQAVIALLAIDVNQGVGPLRDLLAAFPKDPEATQLWRAALSQKNVGYALAVKLRESPLPEAVAAIGLKVSRESRQREELVSVLERQSGAAKSKTYTGGEVQRVAALAAKFGNAEKGEAVYRRPELKCITCHAIGGAGGKVGPDMTSLGASAPIDYLAESLLLPNAKIKEGYHAVQIATADGKSLSGIIVRETPEELLLRTAEGKEVAIPRKNIEAREAAPSLMPAGLVDNLFDHELRDLVRFLSELGKPGPYDATKSRSPKYWRVLTGEVKNVAAAQRGDEKLTGWQGLTTTVAGHLLGSEVRAIGSGETYLATRFDVTQAGLTKFELDALPEGAKVWLDGQEQKAGKNLSINLTAGTHVLVVRVSANKLPERWSLRCESVVFRAD